MSSVKAIYHSLLKLGCTTDAVTTLCESPFWESPRWRAILWWRDTCSCHYNPQSLGYSSLILLTKDFVSGSQRLKYCPAIAIKPSIGSISTISTFSSATYLVLRSSTLRNFSGDSHCVFDGALTVRDKSSGVGHVVDHEPSSVTSSGRRPHIAHPSQ